MTSWDQIQTFLGSSVAHLVAGRGSLTARAVEVTVKVKLLLFGDNYCSEAVGMLTYHIHQSHVKEHASCDGEDPAGDIVRVLAHGCAD